MTISSLFFSDQKYLNSFYWDCSFISFSCWDHKYPLKFNKLTSVFYVSVLLSKINCIITLSKWLWNHEPQASGSAANFDNVMTKFIFDKRTDTWKTDVNLFFTITRPETGQILGINKVFERQVWCAQVAYLHKAVRASPSFQILSVCPLIDDKNQPISSQEIGELL